MIGSTLLLQKHPYSDCYYYSNDNNKTCGYRSILELERNFGLIVLKMNLIKHGTIYTKWQLTKRLQKLQTEARLLMGVTSNSYEQALVEEIAIRSTAMIEALLVKEAKPCL